MIIYSRWQSNDYKLIFGDGSWSREWQIAISPTFIYHDGRGHLSPFPNTCWEKWFKLRSIYTHTHTATTIYPKCLYLYRLIRKKTWVGGGWENEKSLYFKYYLTFHPLSWIDEHNRILRSTGIFFWWCIFNSAIIVNSGTGKSRSFLLLPNRLEKFVYSCN